MSQMAYKTGSTAVFKTQPNKIKPTKKALKKNQTNTQLEVAAPKNRDQDSKKQKVEIW